VKDLRDSNYFVPLYGVVLFLFCISPSAYALSDDEPVFRIPDPWFGNDPQAIIVIGEDDGVLEYLGEDEPIFRIYPPDWPQPYPVLYPSLLPLEPSDIPDRGGQLNLEDIAIDVKYVLLPERPRFNGVPPIDIDGSLFDPYGFSGSSYEPVSSSITVVPEPATLLLLCFGGLVLRRKR